MKGSRTIGSLPKRYRWTLHNTIGHTFQELTKQFSISLGSTRIMKLSDWIHDITIPLNVGPPHGGNEDAV